MPPKCCRARQLFQNMKLSSKCLRTDVKQSLSWLALGMTALGTQPRYAKSNGSVIVTVSSHFAKRHLTLSSPYRFGKVKCDT